MVITSKQPTNSCGQRACDNLEEPYRVKGAENTEVDAFNLDVTNEMLEIIVNNTSRKIKNFCVNKRTHEHH